MATNNHGRSSRTQGLETCLFLLRQNGVDQRMETTVYSGCKASCMTLGTICSGNSGSLVHEAEEDFQYQQCTVLEGIRFIGDEGIVGNGNERVEKETGTSLKPSTLNLKP